jgi:hypothetical protein
VLRELLDLRERFQLTKARALGIIDNQREVVSVVRAFREAAIGSFVIGIDLRRAEYRLSDFRKRRFARARACCKVEDGGLRKESNLASPLDIIEERSGEGWS